MNQSAESKIKVLRIIARLNIGGPAIHVVYLNARLDPARFESLLVSGTENPGEGSMLDYALFHGVQPIVVPEIVGEATFKPRDLKALAKLYRLIQREQPQIVHTHTAKAGFLGRLAARMARVPVILHTYHGHVLHGYYSPFKTHLLRWMEKALARITDGIVAVSVQVKNDLVAYGIASADKITVISLGFDLDPFLSCQQYKGAFLRELGLDDSTPLVGIVGRIFPIKNHRLFLESAAIVSSKAPAARFVIVGDGNLRSEMENCARELGISERVIFTGWRRDMPSIYADLDVLVVSSNNEGTPVSAIEAMAAGRPVVATRVGGLPDIITDSENGYLVPPRDPEALAGAVLRLLQEPELASRMGQTGQTMARERFAVRRLITDTEAFYLKLLNEKGIETY
ncbi:MAG: glycosyltransferase family 4 protein [Desulfosoma sp.]|uniref:glycosyltransferase family 4 protein n=1 Tax=Desulfosoma sp. TaxID=2603217 RepID=UPI00404A0526